MTTASDITIRDLLRGTMAGRIQTVGIMSVIPLILTDDALDDDSYAAPNKAHFATRNYGEMVFENRDAQRPMIVPAHTAYVVKQAAQNHAMAHGGLVKAGATKRYDTACCIQQSQGGYISKGEHPMMILPHPLREQALKVRSERSYGKLWPAITKFNQRFGLVGRGGHLEVFLEEYSKELDEFVAEFELVPKQVGAIVMVNGHVVGVERGPGTKYWTAIWEPLVRTCYGSLALAVQEEEGRAGKKPTPQRTMLKSKDIKSLRDLRNALREAQQKDDEVTRETVRKLIDDPFKRKREESESGLALEHLEHTQFVGQCVRDDDRVVYASVVTKEKWSKNAPWNEAQQFDV